MEKYLPYLSKAAVFLIGVLAPVHTLMILTVTLIVIDLITGIWRAYKKGEKISSNKARRTITKILGYNLAIITALIIEKEFIDVLPLIKVVASVIALTEGLSIYENISLITGVDFLSKLKEMVNIKPEDDIKK